MSQLFEQKLEEMELKLTEVQKLQFEKYYELLIEWNQVMNLTTITEYEEVNEKHFVDSLSIVKILEKSKLEKDNLKIIDIGTGAGFPGIPLKIVFPNMEVVLLDSVNKKIKFLNAVIEELNLTGIEAIHGRAEDYAQQLIYREKFDVCVSRAVSNLSTLSEYCLPYVKVNGQFIAYKANEIEKELEQSERAVNQLGGSIDDIVKFKLPGSMIGRTFVRINKNVKTAKKFPRKAGLPAKEPLN